MLREIQSKSILNKTKRRDPWFLDDYTVNPYSGCSFNCLYCYIRGSKYGENMEEKLALKSNAVDLLEKALALRARKNQYGIIVLSSATDPYLPPEKVNQTTRRLLEIIEAYRFPLHVITKSDLVVRDIDILKRIESRAILPPDLETTLNRRVFISFSFSTIDPAVGKIFEPGAPSPQARLEALKEISKHGLYTGVSMMPLLPFISDTDDQLDAMFGTFANAGAQYVFPASISLFGSGPSDSQTLVLKAIHKHFPHLIEKYNGLFENGRISGSYAHELTRKTSALSKKYNLKTTLF
jgi:DNA repair photolyase